MYILFTDETNLTPSTQAKFFIYGGIFFPVSLLPKLDKEIARIRRDAGYKSDDVLKFDTRARPEYVSREKCTEAKKEVIEFCLRERVQFISCVVHHAILRNVSQQTQVFRSANHVIGRFHRFLKRNDESGICVVDRLPRKGFDYLADKFTKGLDLFTGGFTPLPRIKLFATTCVNASHASSAVDIVLGSFRYCVNEPTG